MISVKSDVPVYEVAGNETRDAKPLAVESHWNHDEWVILKFPGYSAVTINGRALKAAINNAMNSGRF